jgi:myo-inositol 2-dehydrogenase/D-chiro-inositol 1-dehydrogenase
MAIVRKGPVAAGVPEVELHHMGICIIGTRWGHHLGVELRHFYKGPLFVCGRDPDRTRKISQKLGAREWFLDWRCAISHPEVDSVILAIPADLHCEVGEEAARAGKHVFVEKPLAVGLDECDRLISAARESGTVLAAGENIRFRPAIRAARRLLPVIGEPRLFFGSIFHRAKGGSDLQTGILLDFSVHHVSAVREIYGEPDRVFASCASSAAGDGMQDNATMVLSSSAGWQASLALSWQASAGSHPEFIISGSEGAMKIWPNSRSVDLYPSSPGPLTRLISRIRPHWLQQALMFPEMQRRRFFLPREDRMGYRAELAAFLEAINKGRPDVSSAQEARRDLEIVMAAQVSLDSGVPVPCGPERELCGSWS